MVLLAHSWHTLQELIRTLEYWCTKLDISCNTKKTVCMIFKPKSRDRLITDNFPPFTLNGCSLSFVQQFKYLGLGHIISNTLDDDDDIKREIRNLLCVLTCLLVDTANIP